MGDRIGIEGVPSSLDILLDFAALPCLELVDHCA